MSIRINKYRCIGCEGCSQVCPGNLIRVHDNKAIIDEPKMCWGCTACLKECSVGAIEYFLGEDIAGKGGYMYAENTKDKIDWHIIDSSGKHRIMTTRKEETNKY